MGLGIVSDKEFESHISDSNIPDNVINESKSGVVIDIARPGRKEGDVNVPNSLRKIIGEEASINGRREGMTIAKQFGISNSQVDAYQHGATSEATYNQPDKDLSSHISMARTKVTRRAMSKLLKSLSNVNDDKLNEASLSELGAFAKNMSAIVKDMTEDESNNSNKVAPTQFLVYAPQIISEQKFQTIVAKE